MTFEEVYEELGVVPECPDEWYPIIIECHRKLKELDPEYNPSQIKEKWGELRYYFDMSDVNAGLYDVEYNTELYNKMDKVVTTAEFEVKKLKLNK